MACPITQGGHNNGTGNCVANATKENSSACFLSNLNMLLNISKGIHADSTVKLCLKKNPPVLTAG